MSLSNIFYKQKRIKVYLLALSLITLKPLIDTISNVVQVGPTDLVHTVYSAYQTRQ